MPTPIDAIRPHPRNPRMIAKEALAKLCESIQRMADAFPGIDIRRG